ncbi:hypothetical protein ACNHYB_00660 [Isoptericola jiangsuensis]|uniref:hypothetical protein n=1 Tax=Isoptericola jiangsuensis TaxID=548579 RepID=UPI003AAED6C7
MLNNAVLVAEEAAEHAAAGVPPIVFGIVAFGGFLAALAATYAFRNAHNKH